LLRTGKGVLDDAAEELIFVGCAPQFYDPEH
jgi:hypothetical protein